MPGSRSSKIARGTYFPPELLVAAERQSKEIFRFRIRVTNQNRACLNHLMLHCSTRWHVPTGGRFRPCKRHSHRCHVLPKWFPRTAMKKEMNCETIYCLLSVRKSASRRVPRGNVESYGLGRMKYSTTMLVWLFYVRNDVEMFLLNEPHGILRHCSIKCNSIVFFCCWEVNCLS